LHLRLPSQFASPSKIFIGIQSVDFSAQQHEYPKIDREIAGNFVVVFGQYALEVRAYTFDSLLFVRESHRIGKNQAYHCGLLF
jgi:hypothetical protein